MVTKGLRWRRWTGYRSDIVRAVRLSEAELQAWNGVPASVETAIDYAKRDLSERFQGIAEFEALSAEDLRGVENLTLVIESDRDAWVARERAADDDGKYKPYPESQVRLRVWRSVGLQVEIRAERRAQAEGLAQQLKEVLGRGAPPGHAVNVRAWYGAAIAPLCICGALLGDRVPEWLGYSTSNSSIDRWEGLGIAIGVVIALALIAGFYYAFPTIEILGDGELPRHRRLRRAIVGLVVALALTFIGRLLIDLLL
jgi:hypothetical protein